MIAGDKHPSLLCCSNIYNKKLKKHLLQRGKETSEDFYDRVSAKLYSLEQEVLDSAQGEAERRAMIRYLG